VSSVILFNKPFGVLCQFTDHAERPTLKNYIDVPNVYAAGRLDRDSEGLVVLTADGKLQHRISHPTHKLLKTYLVQVEGEITEQASRALMTGVTLKDGKTQPAKVNIINEPRALWPRTPAIRSRQHIPTSWLSLSLTEGRNRQVRRMTAAVGFPTLRLVRTAVGGCTVWSLPSGEYRQVAATKLFSH